jgi:hypothetical protein
MKRNEAYPSNWLKADPDLLENGKPIEKTFTIAGVQGHQFDDGKSQRVLVFEETDARLGLNVTNWESISKMSGLDDDDQWLGLHVTLFADWVRGPSGMCWAVRIRKVAAGQAPQTTDQGGGMVKTDVTNVQVHVKDIQKKTSNGQDVWVVVSDEDLRFGTFDPAIGNTLSQYQDQDVQINWVPDPPRGSKIIGIGWARPQDAPAQDNIPF